MDSREATHRYRLRHWAEVLQEQRESGKTVKAYCASIGIPEHTYYYWKRKLTDTYYLELESISMRESAEAAD
jgi:hypothetical protein